MLDLALRLAAFLWGVIVVLVALRSAIRTFVLPRGVADPLPRALFLATRALFELRTRRARDYAARDEAMAMYAPVSLLLLAALYLFLAMLGYTAIFWALGVDTWRLAFTISGSS